MYITKKELSKKLSVSVSKIDVMMKSGLPYVKLDRAVRFNFDEVEKWFKSGGCSIG